MKKKVVTPFKKKEKYRTSPEPLANMCVSCHGLSERWFLWTHTHTHINTPLLKLAQDPVGPTLPPLPLLPSLPGQLLSSGPDKMLSAAL